MFHNTALQTTPANLFMPGIANEFSVAGVTADDSYVAIEKKMRLFKLNQYVNSLMPGLFGTSVNA